MACHGDGDDQPAPAHRHLQAVPPPTRGEVITGGQQQTTGLQGAEPGYNVMMAGYNLMMAGYNFIMAGYNVTDWL